MIKRLTAVLVIFCFTALSSLTAVAQDHSLNWENGVIVSVTEVHIKPGMFNAYVNDLNSLWRRFNDAQIADGSMVTYRMLANVSPREGEPDLILTTTYPNWATFDLGQEYFAKIRDKVIGSADDMRNAGIKREDLRTIGSQYNLQEVKFKD
jgi:hypothetical protein